MNKPTFVFVIFNMFFPASVGGSELKSHQDKLRAIFFS